MILTILSLGVLAGLFGLLLGYSSRRFRVVGDPLADKVDSLLPQTQCGQCGYIGCRPYAEALVTGEAEINLCVPGGEDTISVLAETLGREVLPISDEQASHVPTVAVIIEEYCIGCTKCIQACPVDAIVGAAKQMHTVIEEECTGCDLCLPPCPVDCIIMQPIKPDTSSWTWPQPQLTAGLRNGVKN
jgi:electron transport complex protein RnfB